MGGTRYLSRAEVERDQYIGWLAGKIDLYVGSQYSNLIHCLWEIPFVWQVPDDKNRAIDGNMLRTIYIQSHTVFNTNIVFPYEDGCTFLEFLIALSMRANDIMYEPGVNKTTDYFWQIISNIGLDHCVNDTFGRTWDAFYVHETIGKILSRDYDYDGLGGLFPLKNPINDQKTVPIWYQMNAYLNENS